MKTENMTTAEMRARIRELEAKTAEVEEQMAEVEEQMDAARDRAEELDDELFEANGTVEVLERQNSAIGDENAVFVISIRRLQNELKTALIGLKACDERFAEIAKVTDAAIMLLDGPTNATAIKSLREMMS